MTPHKEQVALSLSRAKDELEQALAELEHLPAFDPGVVGFAAHAVNNYLTVAEGTIRLIERALGDHPDPEVQTWLHSLGQATSRMAHLTAQLMNVAAPNGPKMVFVQMDAVKALRRACEFYQRVADRKRIRIIFESHDTVLNIRTDRVAAAAVLDNLLSNAVKYSLHGQRIWVRLRSEAGTVVCSIQDEGPGLSAEDQAKLFQKGVRLSPVPTGGEPSTGYGLAVAKDLIGQLGGEIWCESQPGKGACFSIRLPAWREAASPNDSQAPTGSV